MRLQYQSRNGYRSKQTEGLYNKKIFLITQWYTLTSSTEWHCWWTWRIWSATIEFLNAFIYITFIVEFITMRLIVNISELTDKIATQIYHKHINIDAKGNTVLNIRMLSYFYGITKSYLLFYFNLVNYPRLKGFNLNPY